MQDSNGIQIKLGSTVKPLRGFWKGFEGEVIELKKVGSKVIVQFEDNETDSYDPDCIEVSMRGDEKVG